MVQPLWDEEDAALALIDEGEQPVLKHAFFDFDQTISRVHVFHLLAGGNRESLPPPYALTDRGQISKIAALNAEGPCWTYDEEEGVVAAGSSGGVAWTCAALGGRERVEELRAFFAELRSKGLDLSIVTKGYVGAVKKLLLEEKLLDVFQEVIGSTGALYGASDYDRSCRESSLEGGDECTLMHSKAEHIRKTLERAGLNAREAVLVEDDPSEIHSVRQSLICRSVFVRERRGMMEAEMDRLRRLAHIGMQPSTSSSSAPQAAHRTLKRMKSPDSLQQDLPEESVAMTAPASPADFVRWKRESDARFDHLSLQLSKCVERLADFEEECTRSGSLQARDYGSHLSILSEKKSVRFDENIRLSQSERLSTQSLTATPYTTYSPDSTRLLRKPGIESTRSGFSVGTRVSFEDDGTPSMKSSDGRRNEGYGTMDSDASGGSMNGEDSVDLQGTGGSHDTAATSAYRRMRKRTTVYNQTRIASKLSLPIRILGVFLAFLTIVFLWELSDMCLSRFITDTTIRLIAYLILCVLSAIVLLLSHQAVVHAESSLMPSFAYALSTLYVAIGGWGVLKTAITITVAKNNQIACYAIGGFASLFFTVMYGIQTRHNVLLDIASCATTMGLNDDVADSFFWPISRGPTMEKVETQDDDCSP